MQCECNRVCNLNVMHVILHVILCNAVRNESCNRISHSCNYIAYYMPLHEILHACYMIPKILEVLQVHVMACNLNVITCNYMNYMSLHAGAIEDSDANGFHTESRWRARANFRRLLLRDSPSSHLPSLPNHDSIQVWHCFASVQGVPTTVYC